jgi:hypothetical protein
MSRALLAAMLAVLVYPVTAGAHDYDTHHGPYWPVVRPIPNYMLDPWYRVPPIPPLPTFDPSHYPLPAPPPLPSPLLPEYRHLGPEAFPLLPPPPRPCCW